MKNSLGNRTVFQLKKIERNRKHLNRGVPVFDALEIQWLGAVHKRRRNSFWPFLNPPPPYRNFDLDLLNFYLLISCNIGNFRRLPPKIF